MNQQPDHYTQAIRLLDGLDDTGRADLNIQLAQVHALLAIADQLEQLTLSQG